MSAGDAIDRRCVLAVDLGTGGPKIGLVSLAGTLVAGEHRPVATRLLPGGGAVQDAAQWWSLIIDAAARLLASGVVDPAQVCAVACTGQWGSTVPVGADGDPVGDCLLWLDSRGTPHTRRAVGGPIAGYRPSALVRFVRHAGGAPSLSGTDPVGHILFLEHEQPAVAGAARWYLEPVDYLSMRFTGVAAASSASMSAAWLTDNRHLDRLAYDPVLVRAAGVPVEKLAPLVPTCAVVGEVSGAVAERIGLRGGVPVVAGTPDLHSAAAGAGALEDFSTHLAISTTSWISCPVPFKRTDARRQMATVPGLTPDRWLVANNHVTGGRALEWARDALFEPAAGAAPLSYDQLTALAGEVPAGSGGVLFTPWLAGERSPVDDRFARGGFHNLSLSANRAQLVRAVLEGVAFNSRWLHEAVEHFARRRLEPIRVVGGGGASALWCQLHADVLDRTVERLADPVHANLRGAAILAALALGHLEPSGVRPLVAVADTHHPDPSHRTTYDALFAEFPTLYRAQKGTFGRLNRHG